MDRQWEQKLRDKMSQYAQSEPEGLWEGIMGQMDMIATKKKKNRRTVLFMATAAAAAAVAAILLLPGNPVRTVDRGTGIGIIADAGIGIILPDIPSPGTMHPIERQYGTTAAEGTSAVEPGTGMPEIEKETVAEPVAGTENTGAEASAASEEATDPAPAGKSKPDGSTAAGAAEEEHGTPYDFPFPDEYGQDWKKRDRKRFSTSLSVSNLTGNRQSYNGFGTIQPAASEFRGIPVKDAISTIQGNGIMLLNGGNESNTEIHHRQPVRAGVSFKYYLTDRWGLETGLTYSYLSSRMDTENSSMYSSRTDQQLHYLGIPLKFSYDIFDRKFITIYASAGGMVEKCISGTARSRTEINGNEVNNTEDKLKIKPLQWSVNAEAGIQGNITDFLGIYVEPGVGWHFDNRSIVSTIYKEKPLNFNIEFGIRFSFD